MLPSHMRKLLRPRFSLLMAAGLSAWLFFTPNADSASAFGFMDDAAIGDTDTTRLSLHELSYQGVAKKAGPDLPKRYLVTKKDGTYPALSVYKDILLTTGDMYDGSFIRAEIDYGKEALLSFVISESLLNIYRVMNQDAMFVPIIWVDKKHAALVLRFTY